MSNTMLAWVLDMLSFVKLTCKKKAIHEELNTLYIQEYKYEDKIMICPHNSINLFGTNCMGFFGMSGMYRPQIIMDMINPSSWAMQNIHANFLYQDLQARSTMGFMPVFGGSFNAYPNCIFPMPNVPTTYEELAQRVGGFGGFLGINPFAQSTQDTSSSSSSSSSTTEDSAVKAKAETLRTLLISVKKYVGSDDETLSTIISDALNNASKKKSAQEKYDILIAAYNQIDKKTLKNTVKENYKADLKEAGYEGIDSKTKSKVNDLHNTIENIGKQNGQVAQNDAILGSLWAGLKNEQILDVVSCWNSQYDESIIKLANKKITKDNRDAVIENVISPAAKALITKAREITDGKMVDKYLTETEIANINKLADSVEKDLTSEKLRQLDTDFNELYTALRLATITIVDNKINEKYKSVSGDKLTDLFTEDTKKDLESEKNIIGSTDSSDSDDSDSDSETNPAAKTGARIAELGKGWIGVHNKRRMAKTIKEDFNKGDAVDFLKGFYAKRKEQDKENKGILRLINNRFRKRLTIEEKKDFVRTIIESAKANGVNRNDSDIQEIERILDDYGTDSAYKNRKRFKNRDRKVMEAKIESLLNLKA